MSQHFGRCTETGKPCYRREVAAAKAKRARHRNERANSTMTEYRCKWCKCWHLGHHDGRGTRKKKRR